MRDTLFFGDNLWHLREHIDANSVDLVYLDPPFNSNAAYNILFDAVGSEQDAAQAQAFLDTWRWGEQAILSYEELMAHGGEIATLMTGLRSFLGNSNMLAYLVMMGIRLIELRRVMKKTASIYLHCDPTAGHYLKVLLDTVFGYGGYRNEIVWKRTPFSGSSKARARQLPRSHDSIFFYTKNDDWTWNTPTLPYSEKYLERFKWDDGDGRGHYRKTLLKTYSEATFERLQKDNRLIEPIKSGAKYSYKQYLKESRGTVQIDDVWTDINALNPVAKERLGYPTQKPVALLERIISASSNEGDVILDPFCGCGTTVHAAHKLGRRWLGIDVTHYAITLIERRIKAAFPKIGQIPVIGRPENIQGARHLATRDAHQFQWWACWLVGVQQYRQPKGGDRGIDGVLFFPNGPYGTGRVIVSVKSGKAVAPDMVRELRGTVDREKAEMGLLITLEKPTAGMVAEAAEAGLAKTAVRGLPRLQVVPVGDILEGRVPNLPRRFQASAERRGRPRKADATEQLELMLPLTGQKKGRAKDYTEILSEDLVVGMNL